MIDYIHTILLKYLTIDVIVIGGVVIASCLVAYSFWGKSWITEQLNSLDKKSERWVDKIIKENKDV